MRRSREAWRAIVAGYRTSGLTAEVFARRQRVNVATLRWWCTQLRADAPAKAIAPVRFVPVGPARPTLARAFVELQAGDLALRFEAGTDVEYLASLVGALSKSC